jgi:outer membrane protein OmpA-like peptidoglycan-associated protein
MASFWERFFHESAADAHARRIAAAQDRKQKARQWFAGLPTNVIATVCLTVAALTALLDSLPSKEVAKPAPPPSASPPPSPAPSPPAPAPTPASSSVSLGAAQNFKFDQSRIDVTSEELAALKNCVGQSSLVSVLVVGHADCIGSPDYNLDLSTKRANAVTEFIAKLGVPSEVIQSRGEGASEALRTDTSVCATVSRLSKPPKAFVDALGHYRRVDVTCAYTVTTSIATASSEQATLRRKASMHSCFAVRQIV